MLRLPFWSGLLVALTLLATRLLPACMPYAGQAALEALEWSTPIVDKDGKVLTIPALTDGLRRIPLDWQQLKPGLARIVLGAEDRRFWFHPGVDLLAIFRASLQNLISGTRVSGASTISMQLARLIRPQPRTLEAKLSEAWEAMQLEVRLGKPRVLALYLGLLPFGYNIEGFASASKLFLDKDISECDDLELLILSVIPRSPALYDPSKQQEAVVAALGRMPLANKYKSSDIYAVLTRVADPGRSFVWPFLSPQFCTYIQTTKEWQNRNVFKSFRTSLDSALQMSVEAVLRREVDRGRTRRISNGSALFVDPRSMQVLAYVGSADFYDNSTQGQVDGVQIKRQPGSTLKPFLYAMALDKGFTAASILPDIPSDFGGAEVYVPANFNEQFNGPVRLRQALASSLNVPAVYTLERLGVQAFTDVLISLGFQSLLTQRGKLGLGLSLGNAEISLWELVQGFGVFMHEGKPLALSALSDYKGHLGKPVYSREASVIIRDILIRHPDRILAFGRGGNIRLTFEGAIKTGTSNQFNNIWAAGFTPDLLGAVWMGNFDGSTVVGSEGSAHPAAVLSRVLEEHSVHEKFPLLEGLSEVDICSLSGKQAGPYCTHQRKEYFIKNSEPQLCDWHTQTGVEYPQEYRRWQERYRYKETDFMHDAQVRILKPLDKSVYWMQAGLDQKSEAIRIEASGSGYGSISVGNEVLIEGEFPLKTFWSLRAGEYAIRAQDATSSVEHVITVHAP